MQYCSISRHGWPAGARQSQSHQVSQPALHQAQPGPDAPQVRSRPAPALTTHSRSQLFPFASLRFFPWTTLLHRLADACCCHSLSSPSLSHSSTLPCRPVSRLDCAIPVSSRHFPLPPIYSLCASVHPPCSSRLGSGPATVATELME